MKEYSVKILRPDGVCSGIIKDYVPLAIKGVLEKEYPNKLGLNEEFNERKSELDLRTLSDLEGLIKSFGFNIGTHEEVEYLTKEADKREEFKNELNNLKDKFKEKFEINLETKPGTFLLKFRYRL